MLKFKNIFRISPLGSILSAAAVFLTCGLLGAREYDHILLYKNCGTWKNHASVIRSGLDSGRIGWDGKMLKFTPRGGSYDLKNIYCFGFAIRVPENMMKQPFTVKFIYEEGKPVIWNLRTPPHTGWRGVNAKILAGQWPHIRRGKIKAVEFSAEVPGFQAVLDDIRFVPEGLDFQFEEAWVQPVTNGCFFPEYTLEQQRTETLNAPEFKAKMAEIERLRQTRLRIPLKPQHTAPEKLQGMEEFERIQPDGSIRGWSYAEAGQFHKQKRFWHDTNETFMEQICYFYNRVLTAWEWGRIPRTEENRKKLFRSLIRTLSAESNRRQECFRYIVPAFVMPSTAVRAYRVFFDEMDAVEKGTGRDPNAIRLNRLLKEAASWCYFHTFSQTLAPTLTTDTFRGNTNWTGGNFSYRPTFFAALICRNPKMLDVISNVAKNCLTVTSYNTMKDAFWPDGMTADGSAWGHGNQNYLFGYPLDGLLGIGELIGNLSGSRWELKTDGPSFDAVCNYMEALLWHGTGWAKDLRYSKMDRILQRDIPAACGRYGQLYREGMGYGDFSKPYRMANIYLKLLPEGSGHRNRIQYCADVIDGKIRKIPVGTRYFWNNDLLICREKESLAAVSMLSSRVLSIESAPSNSHMTDFWSDGAAWIMKHFDSYRIARGFMKPYAIPGVTSRQWEFTHKGKGWRSYTGINNFAGGAADGQYAVCGYRMQRKPHIGTPDPNFYDLEAKKTYFWLNGKLVCVGTGITDQSRRGVTVATTIDQTLWRGPAAFAPETVRKPGETFQAESRLLWHDGVGYLILDGKGILSGETRKNRWLEFDGNNRNAKNLPKSAPMLMFQIDHGKNVTNGSYAYAADFHCPDFAALKKLAEKPPFEIVSAAADAHVVRENSSGTLAGVFFRPGKAGGLSVDVPAVVLLRQTPDGGLRVTVSDPEQDPKRNSVMLGWNGKHYEIQLPTGLYCGQPATVDLTKLNPLNKEKKMKKTAIALAITAAVCCHAQNLLQNGDFQAVNEKGKLVGWSYNDKQYSQIQSDRPGETEKKVITTKLILPKDEKKTRISANLSQPIKDPKPGKYQVTFTAKVAGRGIVNCSWSFYGQDGKIMKMKSPFWTTACQSTDWKTINHVLEVPEGVKRMNFTVTSYLDARYKHTDCTMFISQVSLTPAAENPAEKKD